MPKPKSTKPKAKATKPKAKPAAKRRGPRPPLPLKGLRKRGGDPGGATLAAVKSYVEWGVDINALFDEPAAAFMESLLSLATAGDHVDIMKYLIEKGADVNLEDGKMGERPLHVAVSFANADTSAVALLLAHGADPNARSRNGHSTPLHDAILMGRDPHVKLMLEHGGNPALPVAEGSDRTGFDLIGDRADRRALVEMLAAWRRDRR